LIFPIILRKIQDLEIRNYGNEKPEVTILSFDSDCIIPKEYLSAVDAALSKNYVDCFGGPDRV
jgi:hypothetical protein